MITQKGKQHQLANEVELIFDMMVIIQKTNARYPKPVLIRHEKFSSF
jgi:hypothetical protein